MVLTCKVTIPNADHHPTPTKSPSSAIRGHGQFSLLCGSLHSIIEDLLQFAFGAPEDGLHEALQVLRFRLLFWFGTEDAPAVWGPTATFLDVFD